MSEATVKALTDAIYGALKGSDPLRELDNEQVYEVARLAAQTIESAGTTKAIIRAWLEPYELGDGGYAKTVAEDVPLGSYRHRYLLKLAQALGEVSP